MRNTLAFMFNWLVACLFSMELYNIYFDENSINIINSSINRKGIAWFVFIITFCNSMYFINKYNKSLTPKEK